MPKVAILTPVFNRLKITSSFLEKILPFLSESLHLIVVDDNSKDGTREFLKNLTNPHLHLILGNGDLFWTGGINLALKFATENFFSHVLTLNDDIEWNSNYFEMVLRTASNQDASIIGSLILESENRKKIWGAGGFLDFARYDSFQLEDHNLELENWKNKYQRMKEVQYVPGNGTLIPVEIFNKIGIYNKLFFPHYHADSSICLKAKKFGYRTFVSKDLMLFNHIEEHKNPNQTFRYRFFSKKSPEFWIPNLITPWYYTEFSFYQKLKITLNKVNYMIQIVFSQIKRRGFQLKSQSK